MRSSCIWKLQDLTVAAFNCCLQLWIPVCVLSACLLQHLLLSCHSDSRLSFTTQLPYLGTSNLLLCQTPSLSKLSLKAVANTALGRNFPFELVLWYLHFFIWKNSCSASFRFHLLILMLQRWLFLLSWLKHLSSYASILNQTKPIVWGAIPWKNCPLNVGWCDPRVLPDNWQNQWK